jgi:hypothetical protein
VRWSSQCGPFADCQLEKATGPRRGMLPDELAHSISFITERTKIMKTQSVERSVTELVVVKGFEGEDIEVTIEQLETKILPQSTAGFLD